MNGGGKLNDSKWHPSFSAQVHADRVRDAMFCFKPSCNFIVGYHDRFRTICDFGCVRDMIEMPMRDENVGWFKTRRRNVGGGIVSNKWVDQDLVFSSLNPPRGMAKPSKLNRHTALVRFLKE